MERAEFLLKQALHEDERGRQIDALPLYTDAADLCIKTVSWYSVKTELAFLLLALTGFTVATSIIISISLFTM